MTEENQLNFMMEHIDQPSRQGRFRWVAVNEMFVPCLLRTNGVLYTVVAIAESRLLKKYIYSMNPRWYDFRKIQTYYMTDVEAKLMSTINRYHYGGKTDFAVHRDFVVKLSDLIEFHTFLSTCYNKIYAAVIKDDDKFGLVTVNDNSTIPFVRCGDEKYVPLRYLPHGTDVLKCESKNLDDSDLAYLQFCCKLLKIEEDSVPFKLTVTVPLNAVQARISYDAVFSDFVSKRVGRYRFKIKSKMSWWKYPNYSSDKLSLNSTSDTSNKIVNEQFELMITASGRVVNSCVPIEQETVQLNSIASLKK